MTLHPLERLWQQTKDQNSDSKDGNNSNNNNKKIVDVDKEPLYICETRRTKNKNEAATMTAAALFILIHDFYIHVMY